MSETPGTSRRVGLSAFILPLLQQLMKGGAGCVMKPTPKPKAKLYG